MSISCNLDFYTLEDFKECVYDFVCQCYNQCIDLTKENHKSKQDICTEIKLDKNISEKYYTKLIQKSINYFLKKNLLTEIGKYYINYENIKIKLTWENIKSIDNLEMQKIFWLLRKLVVDSIIKVIIIKNKLSDIKVYSVGSTKITSDYDITLYGSINSKKIMISEFNKIFYSYFNEHSSIVFDTNLYGKAYINFTKDDYFNKYFIKKDDCGQPFYFLQSNPSKESQLFWGLIKYLRDLRDGFGENIYNTIKNIMVEKLIIGNQMNKDQMNKDQINKEKEKNILHYAHRTLIYLRNQPNKVNYLNLLDKEETLLKYYEHHEKELIGIHDYISLLNFYGIETYFTRGAFLDTVVNSQICDKKNIIELDQIDYITSILENAGFFFTHNNKTKYAIRIIKSLEYLIGFKNFKNIQKEQCYIDLVNTIDNTSIEPKTKKKEDDINYCKDLFDNKNDEFDLLLCQKFDLFSLIITIVYKILKICFQTYIDKNSIPLFYSSIGRFNEEVMSNSVTPPSPKIETASTDELLSPPIDVYSSQSEDISTSKEGNIKKMLSVFDLSSK